MERDEGEENVIVVAPSWSMSRTQHLELDKEQIHFT
jgi:hypothetical protein